MYPGGCRICVIGEFVHVRAAPTGRHSPFGSMCLSLFSCFCFAAHGWYSVCRVHDQTGLLPGKLIARMILDGIVHDSAAPDTLEVRLSVA